MEVGCLECQEVSTIRNGFTFSIAGTIPNGGTCHTVGWKWRKWQPQLSTISLSDGHPRCHAQEPSGSS